MEVRIFKVSIEFQFPSNGKDFPNEASSSVPHPIIPVSIPFKREGLSEPDAKTEKRIENGCFNSLQTGRTFRTHLLSKGGKKVKNSVSIPFKREGLSELQLPSSKGMNTLSFNSLQTGRTFRTLWTVTLRVNCIVSIPFKREGLSERLKLLRSRRK